MAERGAKSSQQFLHPEGLGNIIVRSRIQCRDFDLLMAPRRQNDNRHARPFTKLLDDVEAVHIRETQVEENQIRVSRLRLRKALLTRIRFKQAVALIGQRGA